MDGYPTPMILLSDKHTTLDAKKVRWLRDNDLLDEWLERAAIMQHHGKMSLELAEFRAWQRLASRARPVSKR